MSAIKPGLMRLADTHRHVLLRYASCLACHTGLWHNVRQLTDGSTYDTYLSISIPSFLEWDWRVSCLCSAPQDMRPPGGVSLLQRVAPLGFGPPLVCIPPPGLATPLDIRPPAGVDLAPIHPVQPKVVRHIIHLSTLLDKFPLDLSTVPELSYRHACLFHSNSGPPSSASQYSSVSRCFLTLASICHFWTSDCLARSL